jgi:hypothetical protein
MFGTPPANTSTETSAKIARLLIMVYAAKKLGVDGVNSPKKQSNGNNGTELHGRCDGNDTSGSLC